MMTPKERSAAYYQTKKRDPAWMVRQAMKARERYHRTHEKVEKAPGRYQNKHEKMRAAIAFTENISDPKNLGALEHMAWIAWKGWRAYVAAGSRGPFDLKTGKCWAEMGAAL